MRKPVFAAILLFSALLLTCFVLLPAAAQKASVPRPQNNLALAEPAVRELLPLMHADSRGKVSKQDYMRFMEAEFDRLDADKTGQLDVAALTGKTQARASFVGK
jgi:hypothetical protein